MLSSACAARADVLEIDRSGYHWVTGGPAQPTRAARMPGEAAEAVNTDQHPTALTEIDGAAGPARWRGRLARLAAKYDISPALLEAMVWQESRWNEAARSQAGARGLAQLMPGTARAMGVDADDPFANLEGGARYLRMQLDTFDGDLEKALAAYNAGPARVIEAGGIPPIRETENYVASIMARLSRPVRKPGK